MVKLGVLQKLIPMEMWLEANGEIALMGVLKIRNRKIVDFLAKLKKGSIAFFRLNTREKLMINVLQIIQLMVKLGVLQEWIQKGELSGANGMTVKVIVNNHLPDPDRHPVQGVQVNSLLQRDRKFFADFLSFT